MVASPVVLDRQPVTQLLIEVAGCGILRQQMTLTVMKDEKQQIFAAIKCGIAALCQPTMQKSVALTQGM